MTIKPDGPEGLTCGNLFLVSFIDSEGHLLDYPVCGVVNHYVAASRTLQVQEWAELQPPHRGSGGAHPRISPRGRLQNFTLNDDVKVFIGPRKIAAALKSTPSYAFYAPLYEQQVRKSKKK